VKKILCLFTLLLLTNLLLSVETGSVAGRVVTFEETAVSSATVIVEGTNLGAYTDEKGGYLIKNVPVGNQRIVIEVIGFKKTSKTVKVDVNLTTTINFRLERDAIQFDEIVVTENRAIERETPVAFSEIREMELKNKYTTEDMPLLINDMPGVFAATDGLGEADITIRGFDADKVQIMINGIPVNDPESQQVYWSNWTGLSSNVKSVQVQRGAGSSLYGSGAFGGSVNIETLGNKPDREFTIRSSAGFYTTDGAVGGDNDGKVADGKGEFEDYNPINYNLMLKYNSGFIGKNKINYSLMMERKAGDYYINGTTYDGYSFGLETTAIIEKHKLLFSFIGAPQSHNQSASVMDMQLIDTLGREYNRRNNKLQENFYFKPQFSIRDDFAVNDQITVMANAFLTFGGGGGKYLNNDKFHTQTGEVSARIDTVGITTQRVFGSHARFIYEKTGVILDGYNPENKTFNGNPVSSAADAVNSNFDMSWTNTGYNNHTQYGFNGYLDYDFTDYLNVVAGGELRVWEADHVATSEDFWYFDEITGQADTYDKVQRKYDYSSRVVNISGFLRGKLKYEQITFLGDLQYAVYMSKIMENPIHIFDFQTGTFLDETFYATKNILNADGTKKFSADDYEKTYDFISPKGGINYNLNSNINLRVNGSLAYKEPKVSDWYNRATGPNQNQVYTTAGVTLQEYRELKPEKAGTVEFGAGYKEKNFKLDLNYYYTSYSDKIERITDEVMGTLTINAGKAVHQGIEIDASANITDFDLGASFTLARNRWKEMNYDTIFSVPATEVKDKVVPYSPEKMANLKGGYTIKNMPAEGNIRIGTNLKWWDEYYGSYTNKYKILNENGDLTIEKDAKLPYYLALDFDIKYEFRIKKTDVSFKLDFNNVLNRENFTKASYSRDYGRNDTLAGAYYMYVTPGPLFNIFLTTEIKL